MINDDDIFRVTYLASWRDTSPTTPAPPSIIQPQRLKNTNDINHDKDYRIDPTFHNTTAKVDRLQ